LALIEPCDVGSEAASVMAAVAVSNGHLRLSALKESPFLPSVSGERRKAF
jgi:hypothetical protein